MIFVSGHHLEQYCERLVKEFAVMGEGGGLLWCFLEGYSVDCAQGQSTGKRDEQKDEDRQQRTSFDSMTI